MVTLLKRYSNTTSTWITQCKDSVHHNEPRPRLCLVLITQQFCWQLCETSIAYKSAFFVVSIRCTDRHSKRLQLNLHKKEMIMKEHVPPVLPRQGPHAGASPRDSAQPGNELVSSVMCVFQRWCTHSARGHKKTSAEWFRNAASLTNLLKPTGYVMHQQFNLLTLTGYVMHQQFNLLKPTGYVMHQQFNLLKPTGYVMHQQFNIQQLCAVSTLYLCVLYLSENKQRLVPLTA